jgi:UDP-N-acetylmuramoyl-L-alanyl-D-glutamate--2,6-diaminopimelate ligase
MMNQPILNKEVRAQLCSILALPCSDQNESSSLLSHLSSDLQTDSRAVQTGHTFIAYPGEKTDGRRFIAQAIQNGATAVLWEAEHFEWDSRWQVANLAVSSLRQKAGMIADALCGSPSAKLWMVGVTGTNGKTSCCRWIADALNEASCKCALIGTLGNGFAGELQPSLNTTPDAVSLHGLLKNYLAAGAKAVAMEVSSHALMQGRVNGVNFDVALLTNLSRDHLDYHGNMKSYAAAKQRLFDWHGLKFAVINLDDAFGVELVLMLREMNVEVIAYGLTDAALHLAERYGLRMVYGKVREMNAQGIHLTIRSSWGATELKSSLLGRFNAENLLGVLAVLLVSDIDLTDAVNSLSHVQSVAGRMQQLGGTDKPSVVIDYAHTPDALEKVLLTLRETIKEGRLICVFGCGGDRDRGKRAMMGRVAEQFADFCIVTCDNPRSEPPEQIIAEIKSGMKMDQHDISIDRAAAIERAIQMAKAGDMVLIAGKGHENTQEIKGVKYPFSDMELAEKQLTMYLAENIR